MLFLHLDNEKYKKDVDNWKSLYYNVDVAEKALQFLYHLLNIALGGENYI